MISNFIQFAVKRFFFNLLPLTICTQFSCTKHIFRHLHIICLICNPEVVLLIGPTKSYNLSTKRKKIDKNLSHNEPNGVGGIHNYIISDRRAFYHWTTERGWPNFWYRLSFMKWKNFAVFYYSSGLRSKIFPPPNFRV